jgi:predicted RNase H-like HicB family nuclease
LDPGGGSFLEGNPRVCVFVSWLVVFSVSCVGSERESVLRPTVCLRMGLEFKPLLPWEGEDHDRYPSKHYSEKRRRAEAVAQQQQQSSSDPNFYTLISDSVNSSSHREYRTGVLLNTLARVISREVVEALAVVNNQNLEYPVLVASEEDNVNEYKSFFSIVLDYPQVLGQGETKEYALRQATRLMHFAFGSMLLKGESIPPPTSGSALEVNVLHLF